MADTLTFTTEAIARARSGLGPPLLPPLLLPELLLLFPIFKPPPELNALLRIDARIFFEAAEGVGKAVPVCPKLGEEQLAQS